MSYSNYGSEYAKSVITDLDGTSFEIGIASDKRGRGSAVNVDVKDEKDSLFVLQVRQCQFRPGRYNRVRKDYFLCGRNENGNAFAHPINVTATNATVDKALCRIWDITPSMLSKIVRQGDVALIPTPRHTVIDALEPLPVMPVAVNETHILHAEQLFCDNQNRLWTCGHVRLEHTKHQHNTIEHVFATDRMVRVQVGNRASTWGFARPSVD